MDSSERAFTDWASSRQHALLRGAFLLTGDLGRAEDLVQEALVKVALRWARLASENPEAYARRIIYRDNVSFWRRRRDVVVEILPEVEAPAHESERRLMIASALASLAPRQRAVLVLRYFEDLTEMQTAEVLGISVGTVKSQASDALARLREQSPDLAALIGSEEER
jgi:RNA polymerase sigma-70 factor (sigma-E family)